MDFILTLAVESWTLYSIGIVLVVCRLVSRRMKLGSWRLQVEDWLMVFAVANFTGVVVSVNEVAKNGSNYMTPEVAASLTAAEAERAVYGSKMTLVLEMFTLTCVWTVKACLLLLYYRLTEAFRKQQTAVKGIAVFCFIGYALVTSMCLGYWCSPIHEYWAVPVNISQCATYYHHMMFATAWNISSDLMLLAIPIPIIAKTQLPLKRKIILCCVLGLGVLNIIVAILNRYYNFNNPEDLGYVYFYVAEVATAVYVGNAPLCWPLVRRVLQGSSWSRDASKDQAVCNLPRTSRGTSRYSRKRPSAHSSLWTMTRGGDTVWDKMDDDDATAQQSATHPHPHPHPHQHQQHNSQERILRPGASEELMELTPAWHQDANSTTVRAATPGVVGATGLGGRVNIVRTVEISSQIGRAIP